MASDFLITLRKFRFERKEFPEGLKVLFDEYCKLQMYLRRNVEKRPKTTKEFAVNTFNEIIVEERRLHDLLNNAANRAFSNNRPGFIFNERELEDLRH